MGDIEITRRDGTVDVVAAESLFSSFDEYLRQPCDECPHRATHNGRSKFTGKQGQFCNGHVDWDAPAHARDD